MTSDVAWWVELPAYQAQSPRFSPQHRMKMRSVPVISAFGKQRRKDQKFSYSALNGEPEEILGRGRARGKREKGGGEGGKREEILPLEEWGVTTYPGEDSHTKYRNLSGATKGGLP